MLAESDVTGRRRTHRRPRASSRDQRRFFEDLAPGSFVVHHHHGVARFEGMVKRAIGGHEREYLLLAYRGGDKLYVPSDQVDSIRHYTGGDSPSLSRMGGSDWSAAKSRVRSAVSEVAQELVVLYQRRMATEGWACDPDTPWQRELEDSFEYAETRDQLQALIEVKADMERLVPMDRLIVGDVGFGKTEIAVRAAFKAVQSGRQVAILVPTTLLAQQHTQTLRDRYAPFPMRVEMLSRFLTPGQTRQVLKGLESGEVDVVVGTHRMLSADVGFRQLGLLVIDEEQRFGVRHKEAIKSLRADVDVLTLTATPVPRTLEMSLTGIRDMSLLHTPPADRQPILTYVGEQAERPVAEAIRRELLRDGQVFYVHNRVADIEHVADRVRSLVPEARVAVAHGQMDEGTLERVVLDFAEQEYDVLVCTTIIESGIDMPTVNTLVVDRSDRLGLGQPPPDPRPSRPVWTAGVRLSAAPARSGAQRGGIRAPQDDRGVHRPGIGFSHSHAGPGNPRSREPAGRGPVRTHRGSRIRPVLPAGAGGGGRVAGGHGGRRPRGQDRGSRRRSPSRGLHGPRGVASGGVPALGGRGRDVGGGRRES